MNNSERVLRNTVVMYSKVIISTLIWLYLIRVVLNTLGVEDYGIYSLIAGVVAVLSFVNSALMASTQRFLSFSIGVGDEYAIKKYFSSSVIIHACVALIIVGMLEFCAQFLFNGFLNIPTSRISVAKDLYQLMIVSTFFTILGVPYSAAINAFEDIWFSGSLMSLLARLSSPKAIGTLEQRFPLLAALYPCHSNLSIKPQYHFIKDRSHKVW